MSDSLGQGYRTEVFVLNINYWCNLFYCRTLSKCYTGKYSTVLQVLISGVYKAHVWVHGGCRVDLTFYWVYLMVAIRGTQVKTGPLVKHILEDS